MPSQYPDSERIKSHIESDPKEYARLHVISFCQDAARAAAKSRNQAVAHAFLDVVEMLEGQ